MENLEKYLEKLFSDPGFAAFLTFVSVWYSYYLFKRPKARNKLLFLTTSYKSKKGPHRTYMVVYNKGEVDILEKDLIENNPIKFTFSNDIGVEDFQVRFITSNQSQIELRKISDLEYELNFDIFKSGHGIVLSILHNSKRHVDDMWTDIQIDGIAVNFVFERDDYSGHLLSRNNKAEMPAFFLSIIPTLLISFSILAFLRPLNYKFQYQYIFFVSFAIIFYLIYDYITNRNGYDGYKIYWRIFKYYKKSNNWVQ